MRLGLPLATREKELADLLLSSSNRTYDIRFQGKLRPFTIYTIRVELPKYRLENGRTSAAQSDYIAKKGLEPHFFDVSKSENEEVQEAQHQILKEMAKNSDPEKDLFRFFSKREQEQPLILDSFGFVVNGNRRLATYRELNEQDASKFSHIDIIILPKCDPKDIDELEAHLQVEKDIKQDYSWISLALTLDQKLKSGQYSPEKISEIFAIQEKEIGPTLEKLALSEKYLNSRGKPGQYLELEKTQYAFEQLYKTRPKLKSSPAKQDFFSEISFRLIDSRKDERVYASIPEALEVLDDIKASLEKEVLTNEVDQQRRELAKTTPFTLFGPQNPEENEYLAFYKALKDSDKQEEIHAVIQDAIDAKRERDKAFKRGNSALESIRKANTALMDAINLLSDQTSKDGILAQLDAIDKNVIRIKAWAQNGE